MTFLTLYHDLWLEAKKRVEYTKVLEIMTDDGFNKGHTNFNMFSVFWWKKNRSLSSRQSKLNFWKLHPTIVFCMPLVDTNSNVTTKPYNLDIKCQSNSESYDQYSLLALILGGLEFWLMVGGVYNKREYSGADSLVPLFPNCIDTWIKNCMVWLPYGCFSQEAA